MTGFRQLVILMLFCGISGIPSHLYAQDDIIKAWAIRSVSPINIDGNLNDSTWKIAPISKDFIQYWPDNGGSPAQRTEVKFAYDNNAFYIGAMMYDSSPDSIRIGLSERDNFNNADDVGLYFDPTGTGMNGFGFFVSASGIQFDAKVNQYSEDGSWDAVWESKVAIVDSGWMAEFKIPYTSLRFPRTTKQNWKINIWRHITRLNQYSTLYFVDKKKDGTLNQNGVLEGVQNIEPPLRLSFMPYMSTYVSKNDNQSGFKTHINGGMDLKYGINESFTFDMTLIPDFGQVQSDDKILNISPYEVFYSEKRPFFTEGTELFNKFGMFHSRRVGGTPVRHDSVENLLKKGESIKENPVETRMINAAKVSGRTVHGLGIGIFNGITGNTYATITDSTGKERRYLTQPLTNYNVVVFDQDLKNNSYFNFTNTNVLRKADGYMANVSGADILLKNKTRKFSYNAKYGLSQIYDEKKKTDLGHYYQLKFAKISGQVQGSLSYQILSNNLNISDAGYLEKNNYTQAQLFIRHEATNPFWIFNGMFSYIDIYRYTRYKPSDFTSLEFYGHVETTFKNNYYGGINVSYFPYGVKNYYEPRVDGRYVVSYDKRYHFGGWISTDTRKKLYFVFNPGRLWTDNRDNYEYWFNESVTFRMSNKISFSFETNFDKVFKQKSWVKTSNLADTIFFGLRDVETTSNLFQTKYIFNNSAYASLRIRHYNRNVDYANQFYTLGNNGRLKECDYSKNHDKNYNIFNVDMVFAWRFAPGSELSVVWKNIIEPEEENVVEPSYYSNLEHTLSSNQNNSFSVKVIYYLDYLYLKRKK